LTIFAFYSCEIALNVALGALFSRCKAGEEYKREQRKLVLRYLIKQVTRLTVCSQTGFILLAFNFMQIYIKN
jgi:hypothetical protein